MKKILIVNGPNLNLLGRREPGIYGSEGFDDYLAALRKHYEGKADIDYFQSNCEGKLIDRLQQAGFGEADGIVLNAGAYTHTSIALGDCAYLKCSCTRGVPPPLHAGSCLQGCDLWLWPRLLSSRRGGDD